MIKNQTFRKEIINGQEVMVLVSEEIMEEPEIVIPTVEQLQSTVETLQQQLIEVQQQLEDLSNATG